MLGLYVHIPFCSAICNYCNFNRGLFDAALKARYVDALVLEIERAGRGRRDRPGHGDRRMRVSAADTIYFGGGTPSLLEPDEIGRIIAACRAAFDVAGDSEITLEANPESVDEARLAGFRAAGVNRLSFGVQSFREPELRRLSRLHTVDRARAAVAEARAAGFDNLSLDLMMWLPEQQVTEWLESVDAAIALAPDHLSLYLLEVYPNAPLKDDMARARWSQAPDDDAAAMYVTAMERLEAAGYEQYEISNVARPGRRSRHNVKYWTDGEWLGFGCGAHSTRGAVRWKNVASTEDYARRLEGARVARHRPPAAVARGAAGRCAVHGAAPDGRRKSRRDSCGLRRGRLGPPWARAGTVSPGGAAAAGRGPDVADASGNASCSRGHDHFRIALELCFGLEYQSFCFVKEAVMFRSLVRPAAVGRPGKICWIALGLVAGVLSAGIVRAAQPAPAAQAEAKASPFNFAGDGALVLNYIKPDKTADFESVMAKVKEALAKSEKPERKAQAAGWKIFKTAEPGRAARCSMSWIIDPVIKGNEYSVSQILTEAFPAEADGALQDARRQRTAARRSST